MLRAVCFDLWDTLISDPPGQGEARASERVRRLERALREGGWPTPPQAIADAVQATVHALVAVHQDNVDLDAAGRVDLFYRHLDPSLNADRDLSDGARAAVADAIHDGARYAPPEILPGAPDALAALRAAGLRLALVSNTGFSAGPTMRTLVAELDLARYFSVQVYSDETGAWKPAPRILDEAVFALGVAAADVLFVGDTPEADILGAQQFGLGMTALVGQKRVDGVRANFELPGVADLVAVLRDHDLLPAG